MPLNMNANTRDVRIRNAQPLITPWVLAEEWPLSDAQAETIANARQTIEDILAGKDKRILAIIGP
jgi:3-deoxy-7-phosphoheptulonate synthase